MGRDEEVMPSESDPHLVSEGASNSPISPENRRASGALIGGGAQFTVYDVGDARVLKVPTSPHEAYHAIAKWESDSKAAWRLVAMTAHFREESVPHVLRLAARYPELSTALVLPGKNF